LNAFAAWLIAWLSPVVLFVFVTTLALLSPAVVRVFYAASLPGGIVVAYFLQKQRGNTGRPGAWDPPDPLDPDMGSVDQILKRYDRAMDRFLADRMTDNSK